MCERISLALERHSPTQLWIGEYQHGGMRNAFQCCTPSIQNEQSNYIVLYIFHIVLLQYNTLLRFNRLIQKYSRYQLTHCRFPSASLYCSMHCIRLILLSGVPIFPTVKIYTRYIAFLVSLYIQ